MFKKLLLLGAIVAVIPLEGEKQAELYQAARSTIADFSGFCGRNPAVCEQGNEVIDQFATKAEAGAKMVVNIAKEQSAGQQGPLVHLLKPSPSQAFQATGSITPSQKGMEKAVGNNPPRPARSNERFPSYKNDQYNEHYNTRNNTLSAADLGPAWGGQK